MCDETVARKHYSRIRYSSWGFNQCLLCDPVGGMGLLEKELRQRSKSKPRSETAEEGRNTPNGDATNHNMNKRRLKSMALGHLRGIVLFVLICFLATVSFLVSYIVRVQGYSSGLDMGWVDLDLGSSPGWWAATVAAYCPGRMVENPKSKSTGGCCQ